ncbi:DNA-binding response regulator, AraC family [Paenibacillus pasadenensis]|uniref:DNA-binding response regulator, AraC family n=1 Tax=Paenibacillus pasadenensis TaxID=217090 RepID=A0A2N5N1J8_9BACL|nr:response regulator [Paenibacillus pasadenensis]PLT44210.1 DNA-binding response regulator, AraC family [Paenibacillus pasadenensis]
MYRLLIVDDEKEIREGLAGWDWERLGIEPAGVCAHGLEALQAIAEQPVDIVLTDIRMPFMDGLALMQALSYQYPFIKVIILSGYNDFDYAQEAIRNGASDYLLKPVVFDDMRRAFARLVGRLDEQKQHEWRVEVLKRKAGQLSKVLRKSFLQRLFEGRVDRDLLEQDGAEGEVLLDGDDFSAALLRMDRFARPDASVSDKDRKLLSFALDNILDDIWDSQGCGYHWLEPSTGNVALLAKGDREQELMGLPEQLQRYMGLFRSTFSLAHGPRTSDPLRLDESIAEARRALETFASPGAYIGNSGKWLPSREASDSGSDAPSTESEGDSSLLLEAKRYIMEHYNRSLTLKEVADHVYVSVGHLSSLFKQRNETFLKYLTSIRMDKAKQLMMDNSYKIYEIVELVGYNDPAYFSELFKRNTGKTPSEYRSRLQHNG